jgi:glycosyltransferase involved in cell wall biosynthesis
MNEKFKNLVSVIIPTYNRPDLIKRSIRSVLEQSYPYFEILVINDGGQDISGIIQELENEKIHYINLPENKGRGHARNIGIQSSGGTYLAYLDDDDLFYPNHLETIVSFLEKNPGFKAAYAGSKMTKLEMVNGQYLTTESMTFLNEKFDYDSLLVIGSIPLLSVVHHKSCIAETGYFDETLESNEDWDFWIRMAGKFEFGVINEITSEFFYRTDKNLDSFYETRNLIYQRYKSLNRPYEVETARAKELNEQSSAPDYNFKQGCRQIKEGKYPEAINFFVLYLKSDPDNKVEVFLLMAESLKKLGDEKTAALYFEKARQLE